MKRFGPWMYDGDRVVIWHSGNGYEVDLEKIGSSASMLDWIFQVANKSWCTADDAKSLLSALHAAFRPQLSLCGNAINGSAGLLIKDPAALIRRNLGPK